MWWTSCVATLLAFSFIQTCGASDAQEGPCLNFVVPSFLGIAQCLEQNMTATSCPRTPSDFVKKVSTVTQCVLTGLLTLDRGTKLRLLFLFAKTMLKLAGFKAVAATITGVCKVANNDLEERDMDDVVEIVCPSSKLTGYEMCEDPLTISFPVNDKFKKCQDTPVYICVENEIATFQIIRTLINMIRCWIKSIEWTDLPKLLCLVLEKIYDLMPTKNETQKLLIKIVKAVTKVLIKICKLFLPKDKQESLQERLLLEDMHEPENDQQVVPRTLKNVTPE